MADSQLVQYIRIQKEFRKRFPRGFCLGCADEDLARDQRDVAEILRKHGVDLPKFVEILRSRCRPYYKNSKGIEWRDGRLRSDECYSSGWWFEDELVLYLTGERID